MQLVLIRHAIAEDRRSAQREGRDDAVRPLTREGRARMKRCAEGLHRCVPSLDLLASSPLLRAAETAAIVARAYGGLEMTTVLAFAPDAPLEAGLEWLRHQRSTSTLAVVGHEPHLGTFATWLLTGVDESHLPFRKGGACAIAFTGRPRPGAGELRWSLPPAVLRRLAR